MNAGFLSLALAVLCAVTFGHAMKWAGWRRCDLFAVAAINYVVASIFSFLISLLGGQSDAGPVLVAGLAGGVSFIISFYFFYQAIRSLGLSVASTVSRLSVMPAVLASVFYWGEKLTTIQGIGVMLALLALPLLTANKFDKSFALAGPAWFWVAALFATSSVGKLVMKAFQESGVPNSNAMLFAVWFAAGGFCAILMLIGRRKMPERRDVVPGIVIGLLNVLVNLFMLNALDELPGALVFPISSAAIVLLAAISSAGIWRERLSRIAMGGIAASVASLVLINMG